MAESEKEAVIATTKFEGGRWELTSTRLLMYKDSVTASVVSGGVGGILGGLLGHAINAAGKPTNDGIALDLLASVKAIPGKGGRGTMQLTFVNGKEAPLPEIHDVEKFTAKVNEQLAKVKATKAVAAAAPATVAAPGTVVTLDVRQKAMPGWQALQQWSPSAYACDPADVRLKIDAPGTTEALFLRTKEELGDCSVRLVYRFVVLPKFAYVALRFRSDGKTYGLLRLNSKGEFAAGATAKGAAAWTRHPALHADPSQPNEAVLDCTGTVVRVSFNGTPAFEQDGIEAPSGRIVLVGGGDPKPIELGISAFSVQAR
jgi:hypothetical protein